MKSVVRVILFVVIFCSIIPAEAKKQSKIDSLEQTLSRVNSTQRLKNLIRLTQLYWQISAKKSVAYGRKAYALTKTPPNDTLAAQVLFYMAVAKYYRGEFDSCIYFSKKGIASATKEQYYGAASFGNNLISISFRALGAYQKALEYAQKSFKIRSHSTDTVNIAGSLDNIAHIYENMGNYDKALHYSIKSLVLFEKVKDTIESAKTLLNIAKLYVDIEQTTKGLETLLKAKGLLLYHQSTLTYADIHFNIGDIYLKRKQYDTAMDYLTTSLAVYKKKGNKSAVADAYQSIGLCYAGKGKEKKALHFLRNAYFRYKVLGSKSAVISIQQSLSKVFLQMKQYDSAVYYSLSAYRLAGKIKNAVISKESLKLLSDVYAQKKSFKAYTYYKRYIHYRDSIEGQATKLKLAELQTKYETAKKDKKILHLRVAEKQVLLRNQRNIYLFVIVLVLLVAFMVFMAIRRKNERIVARHMNVIARKNEKIAKDQMEKRDLEAKQLANELNYKTKQLAMHSLSMMQKSKMLQDIKQSVQEIMGSEENQRKELLKQLNLQLSHILKADNDWGLFKMYFEEINRSFFTALNQRFPELTENEVRLSSLIKMNMSLKETASVLNISPNSVKNARYRLKEKLKLDGDSLNDFIQKIGE